MDSIKKQTEAQQNLSPAVTDFWGHPIEELFKSISSSKSGLTQGEAANRLKQFGLNDFKGKQRLSPLLLLLSQFKNPLVLILIFASIISAFVGEWTDAAIILAVVAGSTMLGFVQEFNAGNAVERLRSQITIKSKVLRDGQLVSIDSEQIVPGDIVSLSAGSLIPADGVVVESRDFFVNEAVLTGETFPVEKKPGVAAAKAALAERLNCVFMGTSVRSGSALVLIISTGKHTVFGQIADKLKLKSSQTEFERGIFNFGNMLTQVMMVMVLVVLAINIFFAKPAIESLLFALALAVGLTPELLPAIISVTLSHGAQKMAKGGVIVRKLNSIENFGSMDVLCTDKTGTLTLGVVNLDGAMDIDGKVSEKCLTYALINAKFQTGMSNPLDDAIIGYAEKNGVAIDGEKKIDEIPYDFVRKRLSVISEDVKGRRMMVTKGALENILSICNAIEDGNTLKPLGAQDLEKINSLYETWSQKGYRVLGLAIKEVAKQKEAYTRADEANIVFSGFLLFFDPPKPDVEKTIQNLAQLGVNLKIITGDNDKVALHIAEAVHLQVKGLLTGTELNNMSDDALPQAVEKTNIFAEVDPNQKERIILALKKTGHVVGYMGDGINDAPALHAADVGVSVDTAVDVAKDAADFVLLKHDLDILREGIVVGRTTFANTLKYILTTISANFGNMFSMAVASLMLPFLPLLASQILLNNFLSDIPGTAIAGDNVDKEWIDKPRRWNTGFIKKYMITFGLISSIFDILTFVVLFFAYRASVDEFHTGWFVESLLTELVIALVVRTRGPFYKSKPGRLLFITTIIIVLITLVIPYLPFNKFFGFVPLPPILMLIILGLTALYVLLVEITKKFFYSRPGNTIA